MPKKPKLMLKILQNESFGFALNLVMVYLVRSYFAILNEVKPASRRHNVIKLSPVYVSLSLSKTHINVQKVKNICPSTGSG